MTCVIYFLYRNMLAASSRSSVEKRLRVSATPRTKSERGLTDKPLKSRSEQTDWDCEQVTLSQFQTQLDTALLLLCASKQDFK